MRNDDYDDDDFYDDTPWRGEPNCHTCDDSHWVEGRLGRDRQCPECNPTRLDRLLWTLRWWRWRLFGPLADRRRARMVFDDEGPF